MSSASFLLQVLLLSFVPRRALIPYKERLLKAGTDDPRVSQMARWLLAQLYAAMSRDAEAKHELLLLSETHSTPRVRRALGMVYCRLGEYDHAVSVLRSVCSDFENEPEFRLNLAISLACTGEPQEALALLQQNSVPPSQSGKYLESVAFSLYKLQRFSESVTFYEKALSADPNSASVKLNAARAHMAHANFLTDRWALKQSLAELTRALELTTDAGARAEIQRTIATVEGLEALAPRPKPELKLVTNGD